MLPAAEYRPTPVTIRLNVEAQELTMHGPDGKVVFRQPMPGMTPDSPVELDLGLRKQTLRPDREYSAMLHTRSEPEGLRFSLSDIAEQRPGS